MQVFHTESFRKHYKKLPKGTQKATDKKLELFADNPWHPSSRVHRIKKTKDIWEASITQNYRFTFHIKDDAYILRKVGPHDIIENP
ncbi:MAG: hypothetical protein ABIG90_01960 [bacterium]